MKLSDSFKLHCFVFLGAFLLFTMEPMVTRIVLPFYGGSFHVWTTTLTFFQGILFIGYLYCHFFAKRIGGWHLVIVTAPLIWVPLSNYFGFKPPGDHNPAWFLLFLLLSSFLDVFTSFLLFCLLSAYGYRVWVSVLWFFCLSDSFFILLLLIFL